MDGMDWDAISEDPDSSSSFRSYTPSDEEDAQPFIGTRAFNKADRTYVPFSTQSDAMLASLQLFHGVSRRIMNRFIAIVTHPDFDSKQVTLGSSLDVIKTVEEVRWEERMDIVHEISFDTHGQAVQTQFPRFILYEVLDILHKEREATIDELHENLATYKFYDENRIHTGAIFSTMSLVHRSWTLPARKSLNRVLFMCDVEKQVHRLSGAPRCPPFGPWTTNIVLLLHPTYDKEYNVDHEAVEKFCSMEEHEESDRMESGLLRRLEALHRLLLRFTSVNRVYIRSFGSGLDNWAQITLGEMMRRNIPLKILTLHGFIRGSLSIDPLTENVHIAKQLQSLNIREAHFSDEFRTEALQNLDFSSLHSFIFTGTWNDESDIQTLKAILFILACRSSSYLESLSIGNFKLTYEEDIFSGLCIDLWAHLRKLHIDSRYCDIDFFNGISLYCGHLTDLSIWTGFLTSPDILSALPSTTENLDVRLHQPYGQVKWSKIESWMRSFLKLISSDYHPALKSLLVEFPSKQGRSSFPTNGYEGIVRDFVDRMTVASEKCLVNFKFLWGEPADVDDGEFFFKNDDYLNDVSSGRIVI